MTWTQILRRIRMWINEPTGGQYDDTLDYLIIANMIQLELANDTECLIGHTNFTITAAQREFAPSSKVLRVLTVWDVGNDNKKLVQRTEEWLSDNIGVDWQSNTGNPVYWYPTRNGIGICPYQATTLKLKYIIKPDDLESGNSIPFNGHYALYPYHQVIIPGVVAWFYAERGGARANDRQLAWGIYNKKKDAMIEHFQAEELGNLDNLSFDNPTRGFVAE